MGLFDPHKAVITCTVKQTPFPKKIANVSANMYSKVFVESIAYTNERALFRYTSFDVCFLLNETI